MMDIAALLRALSVEAGMSQDELAAALGAGQSTISRVSNKKQEPSFGLGLRVIELAAKNGLLTNKSGTFRVVPSIEVRGRMTVADEVEPFPEGCLIQIAELPFSVPVGCFAIVVEADGVTPRAKKGDLIIAGPVVTDPGLMIDVECAVKLSDGRYYFGVITEGREEGLYTLLGQHNRRIANVTIAEAGPFFSAIAAGRWQVMT